MNLDKMLANFAQNGEPKYYVIGIWLVTKSYTPKGFLIDMIVSKGYGYEEAVDNIKKYEHSFRKKIETEMYLPLTVGKTVFEATKNSKEIYDLLTRGNAMPDNERIQELYKKVMEQEL